MLSVRSAGGRTRTRVTLLASSPGNDPLMDEENNHDINSVAGVLKLYFRGLENPLFPKDRFNDLISCVRECRLSFFSSTQNPFRPITWVYLYVGGVKAMSSLWAGLHLHTKSSLRQTLPRSDIDSFCPTMSPRSPL